jgi:hypothetical protein
MFVSRKPCFPHRHVFRTTHVKGRNSRDEQNEFAVMGVAHLPVADRPLRPHMPASVKNFIRN